MSSTGCLRLARRLVWGVVGCLAWLLGPASAWAHKPSDSYLTLDLQHGGRVTVRWDIALRDLDSELALDDDGDGRLTWAEVRRRWRDIQTYAQPHLALRVGERACESVPDAPSNASGPGQLVAHTDGRYAVLTWALQCPTGEGAEAVQVDYRLFAVTDPTHRGILRWRHSGGAQAAGGGLLVLGAQRPEAEVPWRIAPPTWASTPAAGASDTAAPTSPEGPAPRTFAAFVGEGMHHIAQGADHVLFLLTLVLVAVWFRPAGRLSRRPLAAWSPRARWGSALREGGKLVTAFTLAHSVTLSLAVMGVLAPPSQWVESLIALSVLLAALDNLWPWIPGPRWLVVFGFGLVHGFGFAGALQDLSVSGGDLVAPLLGFNVGVELGQLAIVGIALPLACLLRHSVAYRWLAVGGGSVAIASIAAIWLIERAFNVVL